MTTEYQNLNSGNRRMNGLNSSFARVGKDGPESSKLTYKIIKLKTLKLKTIIYNINLINNSNILLPSNSSMAGSIFGVRNAMNKFKWYIPSA